MICAMLPIYKTMQQYAAECESESSDALRSPEQNFFTLYKYKTENTSLLAGTSVFWQE